MSSEDAQSGTSCAFIASLTRVAPERFTIYRLYMEEITFVVVVVAFVLGCGVTMTPAPLSPRRSQWREPARRRVREWQTAAGFHQAENSRTCSQRCSTLRHFQDTAGDSIHILCKKN